MRTRRFALAAIGVAAIAAPAIAQGQSNQLFTSDDQSAFGLEPYELTYVKAREAAADAGVGSSKLDRDIVIAGWREPDGDVRRASRHEVVEATKHVRELASRARAADQVTQAVGQVSSSGGGYASAATAQCESGGDYTTDTGNGYYGAYQFDQGTWDAYAPKQYVGTNPAQAPPAVQDATAASVSYDAWPNCP